MRRWNWSAILAIYSEMYLAGSLRKLMSFLVHTSLLLSSARCCNRDSLVILHVRNITLDMELRSQCYYQAFSHTATNGHLNYTK